MAKSETITDVKIVKGPIALTAGSLKDGSRFRAGDALPANLSNGEFAELVKLGVIAAPVKGGK